MSNIAAIFDIDGTVFRDSLLLQHLEKCVDYISIQPLTLIKNI